MAKRKPTGRKPNVTVVPGAEGNMLQHDIAIVATKDGYRFYLDPEIKIVLDYIVTEHGAVVIKINWHSPDLMLFIPPDVEQTIKAMATAATNTTLDGAGNLTHKEQNTALGSDKSD